MKRIASSGLVAAALLFAPLGVAGTASAQTYYPNCDAAFAAGASNIRIGEPGYRPALDRNKDGVACEKESGGNGASSGSNSSGSGSNSDDGDDNGSNSSESAQSTSYEDSDSASSDQVEVVPTGGAETGDGSTADHTGWWLGGGLLAGLAGLLTARRVRPGAGSRA